MISFLRIPVPKSSTITRKHLLLPTSLSSCTVQLGYRLSTSCLGRSFSGSPVRSLRNIYFPPSPSNPGKDPRYSNFYRLRDRLNRWPSGVILWTILGLNGAVYVLWNIGIFSARNGDPTLLVKLQQNFTLSWRNWREGRVWTIITSCFSNQAHGHILMNALTFYFMAPPVLQILGNTSFLALYLGGGIASSLVTLFTNQLVLNKDRSVLGASGAIYAVISFMACVAPKATFLIFGILPFPAWGCVGGLFLYDLYNAVSEKETGVSEVSHLAGILSGVIYFLRVTGRLPRF